MAHEVRGRKVRYAVVAGGQISQQAFMPGIATTDNSELAALVTGDPRKADALSRQYGIAAYGYEDLPRLIANDVADAYYIATPNDLHRRDAVPILEAGYHVLLEKPMATSVEDCEAILAAQKRGGGKLMIAYRLHHEPGTVAMTSIARSGALGDLRFFSSIFAQNVAEANHRGHYGYWSGPVPDMGTYPLNAVRNLFGSEPIEVRAFGTRTPDRGFNFEDTVTVTLLFPTGRIGTFTVSYATAAAERLTLAGSKGMLEAKPCYGFGEDVGIRFTTTLDGGSEDHVFDPVDHFGGETAYFSQCILEGRDPEADGEEGLLDTRVLAAVGRALQTGEPQRLEPRQRTKRIEADQAHSLAPAPQPSDDELVSVQPLSAA